MINLYGFLGYYFIFIIVDVIIDNVLEIIWLYK